MHHAKWVSVLALGFVALLTASSASAATTIGRVPASSASVQACAGATMFVQDATTSAGAPYAAPSAGVITSWSVMGRPTLTFPLTMKMVREDPDDVNTIVGTTAQENVVAAVLNTFTTRIPVHAGDKLALWIAAGQSPACYVTSADLGDVMKFRPGNYPEPALGEAFPTPLGSPGYLLDISAQLEPDADGDGFGDETQDGCPTDAALQGPCPAKAPDTSITKAPKKLKVRGKKPVKATFEFTSSPAGATFACSIDKSVPVTCSSPFTAKVKKGTHTFTVRASASGVADATPATATFKVKKKKHHKSGK